MGGNARGISGKDGGTRSVRFATLFAVILTFLRTCSRRPTVIRKLLLYPPELRGHQDLRGSPADSSTLGQRLGHRPPGRRRREPVQAVDRLERLTYSSDRWRVAEQAR